MAGETLLSVDEEVCFSLNRDSGEFHGWGWVCGGEERGVLLERI